MSKQLHCSVSPWWRKWTVAPAPDSSTSNTMVVPTHSGVSGARSTDQTTRPSSAGSTRRSRNLLPEREAISRLLSCSAEAVAGHHHDEIASGVRKAASTSSGEAAKVSVLSKSSLVSVRSAAVGMAASFPKFTIDYLYKDTLVNDGRPPLLSTGPSGRGDDANRFRPRRSERYVVMRWPRTLLPASSSGGENGPTPPLPGDTVTSPPLTPLFPGSPTS